MFPMGKPKFLSGSITPSVILATLYSNTTLAILNSRRNSSGGDEESIPGQPLSVIAFEQTPDHNILSVSSESEDSSSGGTKTFA
ncbi:hypothetical protein BDN72DRAFT_80879 [Pluteus cervinus]|uniref:Uncharacterized protein n=1 Tax=Pluteus cervinus TaxID=181527 RepID=A0ACD3B8Z2_9AGAR|nr:hypothetical protein BDN72DRAFT_80879 [Pluteus cervinus]